MNGEFFDSESPMITKAVQDNRLDIDLKNRIFIITPSGVTKKDHETGQSFRVIHKALFDYALKKNKETEEKLVEKVFPLGLDTHKVYIRPEPNNPVEKHALAIYIDIAGKNHKVGYIPAIILPDVLSKLERVSAGRIYRLVNNAYGNSFAAMIAFGHDGQRFQRIYVANNGKICQKKNRFAEIVLDPPEITLEELIE